MVVVFATPIWWGGHSSSHTVHVPERLDPIYSWAKDNKFQPFYNKVFGTLVSGGGDGFQHIHGNCYNFATNLGFTMPPSCNIESKAQGMDEIVKDEQTLEQVKNCAINMSTWARVLKEGNPTKDARHGTVDVSSLVVKQITPSARSARRGRRCWHSDQTERNQGCSRGR